jgi:two-component system, NtrC family, sensor kinase
MGRGTKTVGKPAKKRRPTGATTKPRRAPKPKHANGPSMVNRESRVAKLTRELREVLERQSATADILQIIASSPSDVQPVFDALADRAMRLLDCWSVIVTRFDGEYFQFGAARGALPDTEQFVRQRYQSMRPDRASLLGRCLLERTVVSSPDALAEPDPQLREYARKRGLRAVLIVPLLRDDRVEGALVLTRAEPGLFAPREIELVQTFADQAVIAIQNARLFEQTKEALRKLEVRSGELAESLQHQTATSQILGVISSSKADIQPVFDAIVDSAARLFEPCGATIITLRDGRLHWNANAATLPDFDIERAKAIYPIPFDPARSPSARALQERRIIEIPNVTAPDTPEFTRMAAAAGGFQSATFVPLVKQQNGIGTIILTHLRAGFRLSEKQLALVRTFADQAMIAIENARLFDEVQARTRDLSESLQQQTATAEVLKIISRSAFDLQAVLDTLVQSATHICEADHGIIVQPKNDTYRLVASWGLTPSHQAFLQNHVFRPQDGSITSRALVEHKIIHVHDILDTPYGIQGDPNPARTRLAVPLLREGTSIGIFVLTRQESRPFTHKQIELVQTFADQAVIAIENVRLFYEVQARTKELAASLDDLRAAQDRLVQTEKLASLGQLTAGIAHEIKNPLNFVNNFSALSVELTDELNDLLKSAALGEKLREEVDELTGLLKDNLEKVVQHGKRADSIVKNMLLHSRGGSGEHRAADINAIVDESLNLAYHGARAEKAGFNIALQRDLDPSVGMADIYPQEITRALLNLISNGFYAATKRKVEVGDGFEPMLSATTKSLGDKVEIRIRDNGTGIPEEVREKIFNPFFTTKPSGEGTGLGLSMSHDIIVKQHGGSIDVETEPGLFTEFKIVLPRTSQR